MLTPKRSMRLRRASVTLALAGAMSVTPVAAFAHSTTETTTRTAAASAESDSAIVDFARAQIGDPYAWGGSGPGSWDCSGLTQAAYAAAGISLPRVSSAQATAGVEVSDPRPGDLVVYPGHVAIYAGDGQLIDSPKPGAQVSERDVWGDPTYRRVS